MLRGATFAALIAVAVSARAQLAASVGADSEYRFRGVSLSGGQPDLRIGVAYDHAGGAYAGASATAVELESRRKRAALLGYAGYAHAAAAGLAWELGVTATHFDGDARYDYGELYAGLNAQRWSVRAYVSPSYFGSGARTVYAELNGGVPLAGPLRAYAHLGALAQLSHATPGDARRTRVDARAGFSLGIDDWELRLAWVAGSSAGLYPVAYGDHRNAWVASAALFF